MNETIQLAYENVLKSNGGPFAALIVKDGKVIGKGVNEVTCSNDPTAHAEIQAIRNACAYLKQFQLTDCEIYTSCEPCPMCIGAIYWARPKAVYYACTKEDAAQIGFDDQFIYEEIALPIKIRKIKMEHVVVDQHDLPFQEWGRSNNKIEY
ncbi:nucleoside deaminase [Alkalihalobacillus sp. TS-13]|uniref:nucleoside deaminase n=1 Tax=Alkalihalobacillus sp. TS-13 TaxID=2842455 RepID=UPI001C8690EC|nr:nucleoside deaminase [Alkalihalobacillus sp. TS-13]